MMTQQQHVPIEQARSILISAQEDVINFPPGTTDDLVFVKLQSCMTVAIQQAIDYNSLPPYACISGYDTTHVIVKRELVDALVENARGMLSTTQ
jgi:hypothetical protein